MTDPEQDERAEQLLGISLLLADDIRTDVAAAHRAVRYMDRVDLEAVVCILAALVPVDKTVSQLAWWRLAPVPATEQVDRLQPCGTRAGYERHRAAGQKPCEGCTAANRAYFSRRHQQRKGRAA
jgi:hypothetical protein